MPTCTCGKKVADWRGARGHVQFTDDEQHGGEGVPDDWKELFDADADDVEEDVDDDLDDDLDDPEGASDEDVREAVEEAEADEEAGDDRGRLRKALTDDVRHLWGGA
jgi:hypothetical protein